MYLKKRSILLKSLPDKILFRNGYADEFYPFPILHFKTEINKFLDIQHVLVKALKQVVAHYFVDVDIQKRVPLSKKIRKHLKKLSSIEYTIGGIRPDYIYSKSGKPMICEINARFVFNGLYMSIYMDQAFGKLFPNYQRLPDLGKLYDRLRTEFKSKEIAVLKDREDGYDIHSFLFEHPKAKLFDIKSIESILKRYQTIILELHQDEVEKHLKGICDAIQAGKEVINDPRTLFIVHDKRLLSVLSNEKIMKRYLSKKDARLLKNHVIPTYVKGSDDRIFSFARNKKARFVAKKAISGKADGLYIGKEKEKDEWIRILKRPDTLLQKYVEQRTFIFYDPLKRTSNKWYLAGVLPIWKDEVFGPGLYRVSHIKKHDFARFLQPMIA